VRTKPAKVAAKAKDAAARLRKATEAALAKVERKAARRADADANIAEPEPDAAPEPISAAPEPTGTPGPAASDDLSSLTVARLRARARDEGRTGYSRMTKAQLVALLTD
jgi:hypothetical protein